MIMWHNAILYVKWSWQARVVRCCFVGVRILFGIFSRGKCGAVIGKLLPLLLFLLYGSRRQRCTVKKCEVILWNCANSWRGERSRNTLNNVYGKKIKVTKLKTRKKRNENSTKVYRGTASGRHSSFWPFAFCTLSWACGSPTRSEVVAQGSIPDSAVVCSCSNNSPLCSCCPCCCFDGHTTTTNPGRLRTS